MNRKGEPIVRGQYVKSPNLESQMSSLSQSWWHMSCFQVFMVVMHKLLIKKNVFSNALATNKNTLGFAYELRKNAFELVCKDFSDAFVDGIVTSNQAKILAKIKVRNLRNKIKDSLTYLFKKLANGE